ncbi:MAG: hypothetical protein ACJAS9_002407 [Polaribacter sp.]|jgi:hypothetical protein
MQILIKGLLGIFLTVTFSIFAESAKQDVESKQDIVSKQDNVDKHGVMRKNVEQEIETWNANTKSWTSVEEFWLAHANEQGGLTWSQSKTYPEYSKVKEFDTFLVELPQGLCLMEFYHTRWRRANDVHRWDDAFNEYSACSYVFE